MQFILFVFIGQLEAFLDGREIRRAVYRVVELGGSRLISKATIDDYIYRPRVLEDVSFVQFVSQYQLVSAKSLLHGRPTKSAALLEGHSLASTHRVVRRKC